MNPVTDFTLAPIVSGGGVWLYWLNPTDVEYDHVKILRVPGAGPITGQADAAATVILNGTGYATPEFRAVFRPVPPLQPGQARKILDTSILPNQLYTYAVYAMDEDESEVSAQAAASLTAPDVMVLDEPDVVGLLLNFLKTGLARGLATNALKIAKATADAITELDVVEGPPLIDQVTKPCVSVHLDDDAPSDYVLGDMVDQVIGGDQLGGNGLGYLSALSITVGGWAWDNPEVRRSLYRALKGLLMAARGLLIDAGAEKVELSGGYREDFETYDSPMFFCEFRVKAWVISRVRYVPAPIIDEIDVTSAVA